jgi:hypothetical protein
MIITEKKRYKDDTLTMICCEVIYDNETYFVMYNENKVSDITTIHFANSDFKNWRNSNENNAIEKKISKSIKEKFQ